MYFQLCLTLPSGQILGMAPGPDFPTYLQCHVNLLWSRRLCLHLASMPQSNPEDHHLLNPLDGEPQSYPQTHPPPLSAQDSFHVSLLSTSCSHCPLLQSQASLAGDPIHLILRHGFPPFLCPATSAPSPGLPLG